MKRVNFKCIAAIILSLFLHFAGLSNNNKDGDKKVSRLEQYVKNYENKKAEQLMDSIEVSRLAEQDFFKFKFNTGRVYLNREKYDIAKANFRLVLNSADLSEHLTYYANAVYFKGLCHYYEHQYDSLQSLADRYLPILTKIPDYGRKTEMVKYLYNLLGVVAKRRGQFQEASYWYHKALEEELTYEYGHANAFYYNLSNLYLHQSNYIKTAEYLIETIKSSKEQTDSTLLMAAYRSFGNLQMILNNPSSALDMLEEAERWLPEKDVDRDKDLHQIISNKGYCYFLLGDYEKALFFQRQDSSFFVGTDHTRRIAMMHKNIGETYFSSKHTGLANYHLRQAENYMQRYDLPNLAGGIYLQRGKLKLTTLDVDSAIFFMRKALLFSDKAENRFQLLKEAHENLSTIFFSKKNYSMAQTHADSAFIFADSLVKQVTPFEIGSYLLAYEQENEQAIFQQQQVTLEAIAQRRAWLIWFLVAMLALLGTILYSRFRIAKLNRQFVSRLKQQVEEKTKELSLANTHLKQSSEELKLFYAMIAHDFRHPILHAQSKVKKVEKHLPTENRSLLRTAHEALENLYQAFAKLMHFFRLDNAPLTIKTIYPEEIIEDIQEELQSVGMLHFLTIKMHALPPISADVLLIRHVFTNLITNAAKFTQSAAQPLLEVTGEEKEGRVYLYFKDNGKGIPAHLQSTIFDSFISEQKSENSSLGIGLFIVKRIMEQHGGRVKVMINQAGKGTTFQLIFVKK